MIEPGQELEVPVHLSTGDSDGDRSEAATLYYSSPGRGIPSFLTLELTCRVITDYWVRPTLVDFGTVDRLSPVTRRVRLRPNRLDKLQVVRAVSDHPAVAVKQVESGANGRDAEYEVTFTPSTFWRDESVSSAVRFHTNSLRVPTTTLPVQGRFLAPVVVRPKAIVVGTDVSGPTERLLVVSGRVPLKILSLRCSDAGVRLMPSANDTQTEHPIRVVLPDGRERGLNAEIDLTLEATDGAWEARTVTVPIHRLPRVERSVSQ